MSEPDNFLSRWSRRKQEAADDAKDAESRPEPGAPAPGADSDKPVEGDTPRAEAGEPGAPSFDLESLPPIESITADTDIRGFLQPGVPPDLARAALRRAWSADPKIRDFVGLADYDWDYHKPGSAAGFGPLEMTDELRRLVARIVGALPEDEAAQAPTPAAADATFEENSNKTKPVVPILPTGPMLSNVGHGQDLTVKRTEDLCNREQLEPRSSDYIAAQHEPERPEDLESIGRRNHGRALPK